MLSFVIPAYNEGHYLGECLDAIIRNTANRKDVEIIVVDNNSDDDTAAIAASRPGVTVLHEARRGANRARQTGFEAAHGEMVAFLDADTRMPSGWVDHVEREFKAHPHMVCISGPFIYYDLPRAVRVLVRIFYLLSYIIYIAGRLIFRTTTIIQGGNYAVRSEAFHKIGGQNVDIPFYGDDTDNALRLSRVGFVKFSFALPMPTSGRRLAKEGVFMMGVRYTVNNAWMTIFRRPFTKSSIEVRFEKGVTTYKPTRPLRELMIAAILLFVLIVFLAAMVLLGVLLFSHL